MSRSVARLICVAVLANCFAGCAMMETTREATLDSIKMFRPRGFDYRDTSNESQDEWTDFAGTARAQRPSEKDKDPLRELFWSRKALSIERNLGVE